jgi:RNA polymerase sigma factor (sigma-70 family)
MNTFTDMVKETDAMRRQRVFEQEMFPLQDAVFTFARYLVRDDFRAEELVQETYLRAWRFLDGYRTGTNARAWLYRICRNSFLNELRANAGKPRHQGFDEFRDYDEDGEPLDPPFEDLSDAMPDGEGLGDEVSEALFRLHPNQRVIVLMADLEEFSYQEMADVLDIPLNTVRTRLFRARRNLAEQLYAYARDNGYNVSDKMDPDPTDQDQPA